MLLKKYQYCIMLQKNLKVTIPSKNRKIFSLFVQVTGMCMVQVCWVRRAHIIRKYHGIAKNAFEY